jgi:hypothetical protein
MSPVSSRYGSHNEEMPRDPDTPKPGGPEPKGSRSERSEESEDLPQSDRNSSRVRIAKRDGDAGETLRARGWQCVPCLYLRIRALQGAGGSRSGANSTPVELSRLRAPGAKDDDSSALDAPEPGLSDESRAL